MLLLFCDPSGSSVCTIVTYNNNMLVFDFESDVSKRKNKSAQHLKLV